MWDKEVSGNPSFICGCGSDWLKFMNDNENIEHFLCKKRPMNNSKSKKICVLKSIGEYDN